VSIAIRSIVSCMLASLIVGCAASGGGPRQRATAPSSRPAAAREVTPAELRALAMNAADSYATAIAQATNDVRTSTTRPAVADWAWQTKIDTTLAALTNASGANDAVCLLDMVVYATLKRHAMEEHWIPTLLHDEGKPALEIYRRAERDVWTAAGRSLTRQQQDDLRAMIDRWRKEHPGRYYVSHVRFADLAAELGFHADSPHAKTPGSVFGLLHIDPLAGLDPVTAELRNYRALSERMIYMSVRMPLVVGWQVEYAALRASGTPEVHRALDTADRFAALAEKLPADLSKERQAALVQVQELVKAERQAAVDQVNQRVTAQREAVTEEITSQASQLRQIIDAVSGLVAKVEDAATRVNESTSQTVVKTEEAGRRTMRLGFWIVLVLILVLIFGPPAALLLYRLSVKRWLAPVATRV